MFVLRFWNFIDYWGLILCLVLFVDFWIGYFVGCYGSYIDEVGLMMEIYKRGYVKG